MDAKNYGIQVLFRTTQNSQLLKGHLKVLALLSI